MQSLNNIYKVPTTPTITETINFMLHNAPKTTEAIHNVYDLLSIKPAIRYLHAVSCFPTIHTWIKAIIAGNYNTWPFLTVKNVNKYFFSGVRRNTERPHAKSKAGVRSTKVKI